MDKYMINGMLNKIGHNYYCNIFYERHYIVLDSKRYNFTFYINNKQITNNVYKRLFSIENISFVYEKIQYILDIVIDKLNFDENESINLIATPVVKYYLPEIIITPKNKIEIDTELFSIIINAPSVYAVDTINDLENLVLNITEVIESLKDLNKYAKGEISKCDL